MTHLLVVWVACFAISMMAITVQHLRDTIPPDHVAVEGSLLSIFQKNNINWALVKITSIHGYGAGFRSAISPNDTLEVKLPGAMKLASDGFAQSVALTGYLKQRLSLLEGGSNPTYEFLPFN